MTGHDHGHIAPGKPNASDRLCRQLINIKTLCGRHCATIHRAESVDGKTAMTFANASAIRRALENAGVELIEENSGGPGARLI
jgi:hypothetical protein